MARIPESEIERLKSEVSLERLAEARGDRLEAPRGGPGGLCPFHDDREPSLVISPGKSLWHCLGACQAGGSVIDWVQLWSGCYGVVVCSIDTDELTTDYPKNEWGYLKSGVMIKTEKAGLIHYIGADEDLQRIERTKKPAR